MLRKHIREPPEVWKNMDFSVLPLYGEGKENGVETVVTTPFFIFPIKYGIPIYLRLFP